MEVIGWALPPHYDAQAKKLYWAEELSFDGDTAHTLNYKIRVLGRRGVLVLNAVSAMNQLPLVQEATPAALAMVQFNSGNRYADFVKGDHVAAYGVGALIIGGHRGEGRVLQAADSGPAGGEEADHCRDRGGGGVLPPLFPGKKKPPTPQPSPRRDLTARGRLSRRCDGHGRWSRRH